MERDGERPSASRIGAMGREMDLTEDESQMLRAMRAITINGDGHDVFVGLDRDESLEFLELSRRNEAGENMSASPRFTALRDKHEAERQMVVKGQVSLDHSERQ